MLLKDSRGLGFEPRYPNGNRFSQPNSRFAYKSGAVPSCAIPACFL